MIEMQHFTPDEFREWGRDMSPHLLALLDEFRDRLGHPVAISPHPKALGRHHGPQGTSQHNVDRWGEVRAVDVMPKIGRRFRRLAFDIAKETGFTGIGVYPDWEPRWGMHLDVRDDREPGDPAVWSGIKVWDRDEERMVQVYRALEQGFA